MNNKFLTFITSKLFKIIACSVVGVSMLTSVLISMFAFGDFKDDKEVSQVKGLITATKLDYQQNYLSGETFVFDKTKSVINLLAKDPDVTEVIKVDGLPADQYGFMKNGTGKFYLDASSIVIDENTEFINLVSKQYQSISLKLDIQVFESIDSSKCKKMITLEAEDANLYYTDGHLLSDEEKATLPDSNKPFRSDKGGTVDGTECSGGACIRNFKSGMKIEFMFYSSIEQEVDLVIMVCKRSKVGNLDDSYVMKLNGQVYTTGASIPAGTGYFTPYDVPEAKINIIRGWNKFTVEYGTTTPHNFDGVYLKSTTASLYAE